MSHLTASILNRPSAFTAHQDGPSPFEFPNARAAHPLSPPDTDDDFSLGAQQQQPQQSRMPHPMARTVSVGLGLDIDGSGASSGLPAPSLGTPNSRLKKMSYVHAAGHREGRERAQQKSKWLVVVIPPPAMAREHGQLGHTLSQGPSSRLSNGVLMPLFPTMYAQLTAIAREFNFPSTTGVCLYLHMVDNGMTFTPRVSDETWQLLWSHLLDGHSAGGPVGLPIGGRLEFDVDRRQARWYEPWLASANRLSIDHSPPAPRSVAAHRRGDSRTEVADDDDAVSVAPKARTHIPRKLSLVDRFDTMSVRSVRGGGNGLRPSVIGAFAAAHGQEALAPIEQADEPKTAQLALESRVKSWRQSASAAPSALAALGQPSLDAVNLPNALEVPDASELAELNLADFTWSVSSAGPPSDALRSPAWGSPCASVHLDRRAEGSVLLTPTTVSSLGPADYALGWSPISPMARLPSPDLAWRMMDDVPPTPTTVSSLGPADYELTWSPAAAYMPSPDMAWRMMEDVPPTPTTASSLGPASWPASPVLQFRAHTPDLGARALYTAPPTPVLTAFTPAAPVATWSHVWPYAAAPAYPTWPNVWPYNAAQTATAVLAKPVGYPHFDLYPVVTRTGRVSEPRAPGYPFFELYPAAYPRFELYPAPAGGRRTSRDVDVKLSATYPNLEIYASTYPNLEIYPGHRNKNVEIVAPHAEAVAYPWMNVYFVMAPAAPIRGPKAAAAYPFFDLYPANAPIKVVDAHPLGYPYLQLYSAVAPSFVQRPGTPIAYPLFDLYPANAPIKVVDAHPFGYPYFQLYAPVTPSFVQRPGALAAYPIFNLYPAPVKSAGVKVLLAPLTYPRFDLYPAPAPAFGKTQIVITGVRVNYPKFDLYPEVVYFAPTSARRAVNVLLAPSVYPALVIYPSVQYPSNLLEIYGPSINDDVYFKARSTRLQKRGFPAYPKFDLYPEVWRKPSAVNPIKTAYKYPFMCIYKPTYPHFDLYPSAEIFKQRIAPKGYPASHSKLGYPTLVIYPAAYPAIEVYPAVQRPEIVKRFDHGTYPALVIYAAVYPAMEVYPTVQQPTEPRRSLSVKLPARYPGFDIYSPVYPCFRIYGVISKEDERRPVISVRLVSKYPALALYEPVYPHLEIYPSTAAAQLSQTAVTWSHVWPYAARKDTSATRSETPATWGHVWPYATRSEAATTWGHVWPYEARSEPSTSWSHVWPYAQRAAFWIPRFSHAELHAQVQAEAEAAAKPWVPRKSHEQLHNEVFPEGIIATPTTMQDLLRSPARASPSPSPTSSPALARRVSSRARSGTVSARPLSGLPIGPAFPESVSPSRSSSVRRQMPAAPSPSVTIPPTPTPPASISPVAISPVAAPAPAPSSRPLPSRPAGLLSTPRAGGLPSNPAVLRRTSSLSRPMSVFTAGATPSPSSSLPAVPLSPLGEDEVAVRSRTVRPEGSESSGLSRSKTTNENTYGGARPQHARRVSLVTERAKAYGSTTNSSTKQEMMNTLSQFPLPPPPQISTGAPVVSKLDRSKFAAFSGARP